MTELHTTMKLAAEDVGRVKACIKIYREIVPNDKDMEDLEKRFNDLPYTLE